MDYAGMDYRNIRFPVNRPVTAEERRHAYDRRKRPAASSNDFLSVIRMDSRCVELVDRWYAIKGLNTWLGSAIACLGGALICLLFYMVFVSETSPNFAVVIGAIIFAAFGVAIIAVGIVMLRTECFRMTHYPIILDRGGRMVHVMRMNGTILSVRWDDLFFFAGEATSPIAGKTHDLRAHVLSEDGCTVLETFTLVYVFHAGRPAVDEAWAFVWRFMEDDNGPKLTHDVLSESALMPIDRRKEGAVWSIVRTFLPTSPWPLISLLLCIPFALTSLGRMVAMATSRIPTWPVNISSVFLADDSDPFRRTSRENNRIGFVERGWSIICFAVGVALAISVLIVAPGFV